MDELKMNRKKVFKRICIAIIFILICILTLIWLHRRIINYRSINTAKTKELTNKFKEFNGVTRVNVYEVSGWIAIDITIDHTQYNDEIRNDIFLVAEQAIDFDYFNLNSLWN